MRIEFDLNVRGDLTKADLENIKSGLTALLQNQPAFQISRDPIPKDDDDLESKAYQALNAALHTALLAALHFEIEGEEEE